jgi:hypothetical protein
MIIDDDCSVLIVVSACSSLKRDLFCMSTLFSYIIFNLKYILPMHWNLTNE